MWLILLLPAFFYQSRSNRFPSIYIINLPFLHIQFIHYRRHNFLPPFSVPTLSLVISRMNLRLSQYSPVQQSFSFFIPTIFLTPCNLLYDPRNTAFYKLLFHPCTISHHTCTILSLHLSESPPPSINICSFFRSFNQTAKHFPCIFPPLYLTTSWLTSNSPIADSHLAINHSFILIRLLLSSSILMHEPNNRT